MQLQFRQQCHLNEPLSWISLLLEIMQQPLTKLTCKWHNLQNLQWLWRQLGLVMAAQLPPVM